MAYKVRTDSFEGPFDLLLSLVSREKVDIGAISLTEIIDQYQAEVQALGKLDLEVASDFLLVAATLLEIKAASLLPREKSELEEEIEELPPDQAREWLVQQLLTYKQYKNAAHGLQSRYELEGQYGARSVGPDPEYLSVMPDFLEGVTLEGLASLAAQAYSRRELFLLESEHIAAKPIPVELHVRSIYDRVRHSKALKLSDLVSKTTPIPVRVVTFLALLELYKRCYVNLEQTETYGDIEIAYREDSGDFELDEESLLSLG